jgi:hypothetical protein
MIQSDPAAYLGRKTLDAEEILALVIPVELGLLFALPHFGENPVTGINAIRAMPDLSVFQVSAAKFSEVARSLQTLTNRIPVDLRLGMGHDWLKEKVMIVDFDSEKPRKAKTTDN